MNRRKFLKFAGVAGVVESFFGNLHPALAQTWQKLGPVITSKRVRLPQRGTLRKLPVLAGGQNFHMATIRSDGLIFSCGTNTTGGMGDNTTVNRSTFVQAIGISNAVTIACGDDFTMAIRSDGLVFGCGYNSVSGPIGDNTHTNRSTFVQAIGISNAIAVSCGYHHTAVLRADGFVYASGGGWAGQLGRGTFLDQQTFAQAIGISNAVAIASGRNSTFAIRSDGLVFACGENGAGKLGVNSTANKNTFVQALGISNAVMVSASVGGITTALRCDGLVFSCGTNYKGGLGHNSAWTASKSTFEQALGISNAVAVACGYDHAAALRADGLVFTCGYNNNGQLGINTTANKSTYVQAIGISNAVAISCGNNYTIALRSDGFIFACGNNANGQLGTNAVVNKSTFVQVTSI